MGIAIISPGRNASVWVENIHQIDPNISVQVYPDFVDKSAVEAVLLWQQPKGILHEFPNLKLICSMGAGVDHILEDETVPIDLPITRIVDEKLMFSMTNYVVMGVLNHHRQFLRYQRNQKLKVWDMSQPELDVTVGVMGVGELGGDVIKKLQTLHFKCIGFGNSPKSGLGFPYYHSGQMDAFLSKANVIVCLLPLTPQTENILNIGFFRKCRKGTYLINVARGRHLVEEDLLSAIEEGLISGALLDVYNKEPLPEDHPFWESDKIMLTPHIASVTNPEAAAPQAVRNYRRMKAGNKLINQIDREKGY